MGFVGKHQMEGVLDSDGRQWVISGVVTRSKARAMMIRVKPREKEAEEEEEECPRTPTAKEARIPENVTYPGAPRKRRPSSSRCGFVGAVEFFVPPDLESVFVMRAN